MTDKANNQVPFNWKKIIRRTALLIAIGVIGNVIFTLWNFDQEAVQQLISFSPFFFVIAILLALVPWVFHAFEIIIWTDFFKKKLAFRDALMISVATDIGSAITPTMVGGAPIKAGLLIRKGIKAGFATAMVTFTALEDLIFFLIIIPASLIFSKTWGMDFIIAGLKVQAQNIPRLLLIIFAGIALLFLLRYLLKRIFHTSPDSKWLRSVFNLKKKVGEVFREFKSALRMIATNGKTHFLLATLCIGARWISRFMILIVLVKSLNAQADYLELFFSEWLVHIGMMLVPTPGAVGGAEGAFYFIFQPLLPSETIRILTAGWRFLTYYMLLILAVAYLYASIGRLISTERVNSSLE